MNNIVSFDDVTVAKRKTILLKNISLDIRNGSFVSIIGPNGAGKSTLVKLINGLDTPISGVICVFGEPLRRVTIGSVRKYIGYVPQHVPIDSRAPLSVLDAVRIGRFGILGMLGKWTAEDDAAIDEAINTVGIKHLTAKPIGHLSGGEHQKVSIARAIAQKPHILLFDEPTSNLDPKSQHDIMALIEEIYKKGHYTIVLVTHILSHIPDSCTDAVLMKRGAVQFAGSISEAMHSAKLSALYDCSVQISRVNGRRHFHIGMDHV